MMNEQENGLPGGDLPAGLSKPAQRALANAGLSSLEHVSKLSEREFAELHGIGPKAVDLIRRSFAAKGLSFKE